MKENAEGKVRVIRDTRDASRDYFISEVEAEKLFNQGKLVKDLTNNCYAVPTRTYN